ncbi:hypothetical protein K503DRAFT_813762 [Rhizopogon vinicolor AM-OR11-026]|uniref:Heterokaryon incompatibility domain-containing protein n=1 Tax=Rhizopogon vinicolor AM-OR11-026 TaxID=1314800 RepID=A0A1B7MFH0_9AGAM|nr:hypothetical protein K503DRAFT_813762 [Rhizopogon vinicolor AM-OR11-026]
MPTDIEDDEPLCSTCSALDLWAMMREGIEEEHPVLLGHLTDVFNKHDQCGFCRLTATHIRHTWQLDKQPGINIDGKALLIVCGGVRTCGAGLNDTLPKDICHHLYIKTSTGPRSMYIFATMPQSPLTRTLEIRLLEEDASKVGRMRQFDGRRVGQTVDVDLLKRWIHTSEKKHGERCEMVFWRVPGEVLPDTVRVVDVTHMAIIPAPSACRYVTLSYVWGGPGEGYWTIQANIKQRSVPGNLDASALPGTISDTI